MGVDRNGRDILRGFLPEPALTPPQADERPFANAL
jgi:hypothetical protein